MILNAILYIWVVWTWTTWSIHYQAGVCLTHLCSSYSIHILCKQA
uniref:Uncharacterized protein n=1 Tax=Arundo donax TaxID=35708 RepID=A0A0A8Z075_ARUDO